MIEKCKHCKLDIEIRNLSGYCDHLYYPENCKICSGWEDFDKIFNKIFQVNVKYQAFTTDQWNQEVAPLFRKMRSLLDNQRAEVENLSKLSIVKKIEKYESHKDEIHCTCLSALREELKEKK